MELSTNLKDAIAKIEELTRQAQTVRMAEFILPDGREKVEVQVPISVDNEGRVDIHLDSVKALGEYAKRLRLENAKGPDARMGTAKHETISSLVAHARRFRSSDSVLYANPKDLTLTAIYDYHPGGPNVSDTRWCKHQARYRALPSAGWAAWGGMGQVSLTQEQFCGLIERRDDELSAGPEKKFATASALLTMVQEMESTSTVRAKRTVAGGHRTKLVLTKEDGAAGEVEIPSKFAVAVPVFTDCEAELHEVRLAITVKDAQPTFHLEIHQASRKMLKTFAELGAKVGLEADLPVFVGTPEA